jgi:hypothetical protein
MLGNCYVLAGGVKRN